MSGLSEEFEQQWLSLHSCKVKFMAECKTWCAENAPEISGKQSVPRFRDQRRSESLLPSEVPEGVIEATTRGDSATAQALTPQLRAVAVELFRRYFSPDMYFIFPLIVGREAAFGLDFRTTTTTLFFKPDKSEEETQVSKAAPKGACSWRFRWPPELSEDENTEGAPLAPASLLEVLFIAVWEEERDQVHGGSLVVDLEEQARASGVKMLYVEI